MKISYYSTLIISLITLVACGPTPPNTIEIIDEMDKYDSLLLNSTRHVFKYNQYKYKNEKKWRAEKWLAVSYPPDSRSILVETELYKEVIFIDIYLDEEDKWGSELVFYDIERIDQNTYLNYLTESPIKN